VSTCSSGVQPLGPRLAVVEVRVLLLGYLSLRAPRWPPQRPSAHADLTHWFTMLKFRSYSSNLPLVLLVWLSIDSVVCVDDHVLALISGRIVYSLNSAHGRDFERTFTHTTQNMSWRMHLIDADVVVGVVVEVLLTCYHTCFSN
jgi:hypothetical protein